MQNGIIESLTEKYSVTGRKEIMEQLTQELGQEERSIHRKLCLENPFYENQEMLKKALRSLMASRSDVSLFKKDLTEYNQLISISDVKIDNSFWAKEVKNLRKLDLALNFPKDMDSYDPTELSKQLDNECKLTRKLLHQKWQQSLDEEYQKWEFKEIERYRKELLKKL